MDVGSSGVASTSAVQGTATAWPDLRAKADAPARDRTPDLVTGVVERQRYDDNHDGRVDFRDPSWWSMGSHPVQAIAATVAVPPTHPPAEIDAARRAYRDTAPIRAVERSGRTAAS